jgi:hypothetical protein
VTERDAFGNLIDDDPGATAGLSRGDPLRTSAATTTLTPRAPERVRGSWDITDKLVGLFFVGLFLVPLAIGAWLAYTAWHDTAKPAISAIKSVQRDLAPTTTAADGNTDDHRTPAGPPRGLSAESLLKPAALDRILAGARRDPGGKLGLLRLAPERADLQLARKGGGMDLLQLRYDGGRSLIHTPGTPPATSTAFSTIDTHAPQRLVTAAAHRLHRSTKAIDYVVLIGVLDEPTWSAYFTGGAAFQGDAHGHITRRIQ